MPLVDRAIIKNLANWTASVPNASVSLRHLFMQCFEHCNFLCFAVFYFTHSSDVSSSAPEKREQGACCLLTPTERARQVNSYISCHWAPNGSVVRLMRTVNGLCSFKTLQVSGASYVCYDHEKFNLIRDTSITEHFSFLLEYCATLVSGLITLEQRFLCHKSFSDQARSLIAGSRVDSLQLWAQNPTFLVPCFSVNRGLSLSTKV